jgi:hypothetical protein
VKCTTYNDFDNLDWLGHRSGVTPIFATEMSGRWFCIEAHVKLNDPGAGNGVQEFFIDDQLEARRDGLDFVRGYTDYGINAVFFENYWNAGSPRDQERYFDNIVIAESRIGCLEKPGEPTATATSTATPTAPTAPSATLTAPNATGTATAPTLTATPTSATATAATATSTATPTGSSTATVFMPAAYR